MTLWKRLADGSYARRTARPATFAWILESMAAALFALALAFTVATLADGGTAAEIALGCTGMVLAGILRAALHLIATEIASIASINTRQQARHLLWPALLSTGLARGRPVGEDMALAVDTLEALDPFMRYQPLRMAAVVSPLAIAAIVACVSPISAAILILTLIPFGLGMALAGTAAGKAAERQLVALTRLSGLFLDRVRALPEILSFRAEDRITRHIGSSAKEAADRTLATMRIAFVSGGIIEFFAAISVALVAVYCGFNLLGLLPFPVPEKLSLFQAFFALAMAPEFYLPMRRLAAAYHDRQAGEAALSALAAEAPSPSPPAGVSTDYSGVDLTDVTIAYDGGAIGPVSLSVGKTGLVVLVGPTGSGKSSVLHAALGLVPLASGSIRWNAGAAPAIGWAGQRILLTPGTLADAIALGRPGAARQEIEQAAIAAGLAPLLHTRGLSLAIDTRGSGLSGGERRRIGLARAIVSGRPLLLLDEPTADLDPSTAAAIRATIADLARTHALLVATHDEELMRIASSVVRLS